MEMINSVLYSFEDISLIYEARNYLTKERFEHHLTVSKGLDPEYIKNLWTLWNKFPHFFRDGYGKSQDTHILLSSIRDFMKRWHLNFEIDLKDYNKTFRDERLVIYLEGSEVKKAEIDLLLASDIIAYAELVQRADKIHAVLPFLEEIEMSKHYQLADKDRQMIKVYDQDLFSANDDYWNKDKSTLFVADISHGSYRAKYTKLLYMKGRGYVDKDGDPNYDDKESYNHHVLTGTDRWTKIGNLITDSHLLKDPK